MAPSQININESGTNLNWEGDKKRVFQAERKDKGTISGIPNSALRLEV